MKHFMNSYYSFTSKMANMHGHAHFFENISPKIKFAIARKKKILKIESEGTEVLLSELCGDQLLKVFESENLVLKVTGSISEGT